jgi:hypothetical protein
METLRAFFKLFETGTFLETINDMIRIHVTFFQ